MDDVSTKVLTTGDMRARLRCAAGSLRAAIIRLRKCSSNCRFEFVSRSSPILLRLVTQIEVPVHDYESAPSSIFRYIFENNLQNTILTTTMLKKLIIIEQFSSGTLAPGWVLPPSPSLSLAFHMKINGLLEH